MIEGRRLRVLSLTLLSYASGAFLVLYFVVLSFRCQYLSLFLLAFAVVGAMIGDAIGRRPVTGKWGRFVGVVVGFAVGPFVGFIVAIVMMMIAIAVTHRSFT